MKRIAILGIVVVAGLALSAELYGQSSDVVWSRTFDEGGNEECNSILMTSDGGFALIGFAYLADGRRGDVYIIRTDPEGNLQWKKRYGGDKHDCGLSVRETKEQGFVLVGNTCSYGAGCEDIWLLQTDAVGNTLWTKTYGSPAMDRACGIDLVGDDGFIIGGTSCSSGSGKEDICLMRIGKKGNLRWSKTFGGEGKDCCREVMHTNDGGFLILGNTCSFGAGCDDILLIKTDSDGEKTWQKTYGGEDFDCASSIRRTSDGGYVIVGSTRSSGSGEDDVYLLRLDSAGNVVWSKTYGGEGYDWGEGVQQTSDGGFAIVGITGLDESKWFDIYLIKTDETGNTLWSKTFGGVNWDAGYAVFEVQDGSYVIGGNSASLVDYSSDMFLSKVR